MFEKLKQKLKKLVERVGQKTKQEAPIEAPPPKAPEAEPQVIPQEKPSEPAPKVSAKVSIKTPTKPPVKVSAKAPAKAAPPPTIPTPKKPSRIFRRAAKRITRRELSPEDVEDIVWDLQVDLLESDVAVPVADKIIERTKEELSGRKLGLTEDPKKLAEEALRQAIREVLITDKRVDLLKIIDEKRAKGDPAVFVFVGINGHGKTTTIAKFAKWLMDRGYKPVLAAADTFRAAAIEQLEIHAQRLGLGVVKQKRGADAAAVAYDAVAHAKARGLDVVLVDTAGRMQTDVDLMDEMRKIIRVVKPDLTIFVGDALTGNDAIEQASAFNQAVEIGGSILCKMDADARGGAALSITQVTGKPLLFIGTGQEYGDLEEFNPDKILNALFSD
jgi:fused signal recognition particle receptor